MLDTGQKIRNAGCVYQVVRPAGVGGEGYAYEAIDLDRGDQWLLKRFHDHHDPQVSVRRTQYLIDQNLEIRCPLLTPPATLISPNGSRRWCGYVARYRAGEPLSDWLAVPEVNFLDNLQLAVALVHGIDTMHQVGLSHGDIHPRNVIVLQIDDVLVPYWIDHDNFNADGIEPSRAWGTLEYIAPEGRLAMVRSEPYPPDISADLFSLTCLLHETLQRRHVAAGHDQDPETFHRTMISGIWMQDPSLGRIDHETMGGLSNVVINASIARLFRRGLSLERDARPSASEWKSALLQTADQVYHCPTCGYPNLVDGSKHRCPSCALPYPVLAIQTPDAGPIVIDQATVSVGRNQLPSPRVSQKHAVLRRIGPETWLDSIGRNGTYRMAHDGSWIRLPDEHRHLVEAGDRLRFADVEVRIANTTTDGTSA